MLPRYRYVAQCAWEFREKQSSRIKKRAGDGAKLVVAVLAHLPSSTCLFDLTQPVFTQASAVLHLISPVPQTSLNFTP